MKRIIILFILISSNFEICFAKDNLRSYKFFKKEAASENKRYKYNRYEDIVSGGLALAIGNLGYFSTESKTIRLTYSLVQTIGFLNIGKGVYNFHRPQVHYEQYKMLRNYKKGSKAKTIEYFSKEIIRNIALEDRAKRLSVLYTSSLLTIQYLVNIYGDKLRDKQNKGLNNIYFFLGGVNLIIATHSFYNKSKYEQHHFSEESSKRKMKKIKKKNYTLTPFILPQNKSTGLVLSYSF